MKFFFSEQRGETMSEVVKTFDDKISLFISKLSETTGFKYLKSRRALKYTVGSIVFEVLFFSSKWNEPENIEINADLRVSYKKYGEASNICSIIAAKSFRPDENYWFNISTDDKFDEVLKLFDEELHVTVVELAERFEKDFYAATRYLLDEKFYDYNVELDFLEDILGEDKIMYRVHEISEALSDAERQQVEDYRNGARNKQWMLNRCNLHYIVDKGYI